MNKRTLFRHIHAALQHGVEDHRQAMKNTPSDTMIPTIRVFQTRAVIAALKRITIQERQDYENNLEVQSHSTTRDY